MQVTFVTMQASGKETREKTLYTESWALLTVGMTIKTGGRKYIVQSTQWTNRTKGQIKAICQEFVHPCKKQNQ